MNGRPRLAFGLFVHDGRLLLVHRRPDRADHPDTWDLPGGHVEPGETPEQALRREVREELGVEVTRFARMAFPDFFPAVDTRVFAVTSWDGEPFNAAPEEHDDLRWFTAAEVGGLRTADPRFGAWLGERLAAAPGLHT